MKKTAFCTELVIAAMVILFFLSSTIEPRAHCKTYKSNRKKNIAVAAFMLFSVIIKEILFEIGLLSVGDRDRITVCNSNQFPVVNSYEI